jgi:hypothetical protein
MKAVLAASASEPAITRSRDKRLRPDGPLGIPRHAVPSMPSIVKAPRDEIRQSRGQRSFRTAARGASATLARRPIGSGLEGCCGHGVLPMKVKPHGLDPASVAALVVRAIDDIDKSSDERRRVLLGDLLCAAWGTPHHARSQ